MIDEVEKGGTNYLTRVLRARCYLAMDSIDRADATLRLVENDSVATPTGILSRAHIQLARGDSAAALATLLPLEQHFSDRFTRHSGPVTPANVETLRLIASIMESQDREAEATRYYKLYAESQEQLFSEREKMESTHYRTLYDISRKELELTAARAALQRNRLIAVGILSLVVILTGAAIIYLRKRNHLLSIIVARQKRLLEVDAPTPMPPASPSSGPGVDRSEEIWANVLRQMKEDIYLDPALSRDMLAERIKCNHTWLSQVIKERTGKSFPSFIRSYRVEAALKILSSAESIDKLEDVWRRCGFTSKGMFYKAFREEIGMSPMEYRERATDSPKASD